ncbi:phosphoribosyltransferase family protein [Streptomyces sp. HC307]|uniref:phosphoribosyltransferase family protein n=1 Tax=Streptomyces flavusporus TaxID=3385496 RepID=UPI00391740C9
MRNSTVDIHPIRIGTVQRDLPVVPVSADLSIAFLKLYGDLPLVEAATTELAARLEPGIDIIVGPETGGILLAHKIAEKTGKPYVVARKKIRPYMRSPLSVPVSTIGTAGVQQLVLGEDDAVLLNGARVAVVDEVVSSGGTLTALGELIAKAGGRIAQTLAVATEGAPRPTVVSLCHLPLFPTDGAMAEAAQA